MPQAGSHTSTPTVDLHGAFIRRVDLSNASLRNANFVETDAKNANFRNSDFENARLDGMILQGADLTGARNLTVEQLSHAVIDASTLLPDYIDRNKLDALVTDLESQRK
jgi:uncharacterized protein YjbI with pentapeptide repeats